MSEGTFKKIGGSNEAMYGPRGILVCGFAPLEQEAVMRLVDTMQLPDIPMIFATAADGEIHLGELLTRTDQSGRDADSGTARSVIMSGITERELHHIISCYKDAGLPDPLWATLTPVSEQWALSVLLEELKREHRAMGKKL